MKKILLSLFVFSFLIVGYNVQATEEVKDTELNVCCESYGVGSMGIKTPSTHKMTPKSECSTCTLDMTTGLQKCIVGGVKKIVDNSFCVTTLPVEYNNPVISGVKGPQTLRVGQKGEWEIKASAPWGNLSYDVIWGDEVVVNDSITGTTKQVFQQTATFTHVYTRAGIYKPKFTVRSTSSIACVTTPCPSNGGSASISISVVVNDSINVCPDLVLLNCEKGYSQVYSGKDSNGCDSYSCKKDFKNESCLPGYKFSPKTGEVCPIETEIDGCIPGYKFSPMTGKVCVVKEKICTEPGSNCGVRNYGISRTLKHGIKGEDVKVLQSLLNLIQDGIFGPETKQKLIDWQKENGLTPDGSFGAKSRQKAGFED